MTTFPPALPRLSWAGLLLAALAACDSGAPKGRATADLSQGVMRVSGPDVPPPPAAEGACWTSDVTPAIIETVSEQVIATAAVTDADGRVLSPATYATSSHQRILRDRQTVHIRTPCPEDVTPDFVASVQRALKARGYYLAPVTGTLDPSTREAVRRFQEPLGLDSPELSLEAARRLGIVAADPDAL